MENWRLPGAKRHSICIETIKTVGKTVSQGCETSKTIEADIQLAGTGMATIDWGDGSASEAVTLSEFNGGFTESQIYLHAFSDTTSRTIIIEGEDITRLFCDGLQLTALDVTKNTALTYLSCYYNSITALDVSKNTEMEWLDCQWYQLTSLDLTQNRSVKNSLVSTLRSQLNSYLCGVK